MLDAPMTVVGVFVRFCAASHMDLMFMILELEKSWKSHWMVSQHYEPFKKLVLNSNCRRPSRKNQEFDDKLMGELIRFVSSTSRPL
jgi:hypothetical protein